jgi:hypothetical protein
MTAVLVFPVSVMTAVPVSCTCRKRGVMAAVLVLAVSVMTAVPISVPVGRGE